MNDKVVPAPAVPVPDTFAIRNQLDQRIRSLLESEDFQECTTLRDQIAMIHSFIPNATSYRISRHLQIHQSRVDFQLRNIERGPVRPGRPAFLTEDVLDDLNRLIQAAAKEKLPATISDISHHLNQQFGLDISQDTLRKALKRCPFWQLHELDPIDHNRQHVSEEAIRDYQDRLRRTIDHEPAKFVFNCDESRSTRP